MRGLHNTRTRVTRSCKWHRIDCIALNLWGPDEGDRMIGWADFLTEEGPKLIFKKPQRSLPSVAPLGAPPTARTRGFEDLGGPDLPMEFGFHLIKLSSLFETHKFNGIQSIWMGTKSMGHM